MNTENKRFSIEKYGLEESQRILEYWTPERKATAKPFSPLKITSENLNEPTNFISAEIGKPFEADVKRLPFYKAGKFFFTKDNKDIWGSAQFVGHCQIVLTAAHCVRDIKTGELYKNLLFSLGYIDGEKSKDYVFDNIGTPDEYVGRDPNDINKVDFDYAFCRTTERSESGQMVLQIGMPYPPFQRIWSIGYPEEKDYGEGKRMYAVEGARGDIRGGRVAMGFNPFYEGGSSGGAWIVNLTNGGTGSRFDNIVVGINSAASENRDHMAMYSPYFNQNTLSLFNEVLDATIENPRRCDIIP